MTRASVPARLPRRLARRARVDVAISNFMWFGGHNATLVLKRVEC
jgi:hypothetical protein